MHEAAPAASQKTPGRRSFAWLTAVLLVYVSWEALHPNAGGAGIAQFDKLLHFSAFATLAVSSALALGPGRRNHAVMAAALLLYGASIEVLQLHMPGRDANAMDLLADAAGIAAGLAIAGLLQRWPGFQRLR